MKQESGMSEFGKRVGESSDLLLQIGSYIPGVPRDPLFAFDCFAYTAAP